MGILDYIRKDELARIAELESLLSTANEQNEYAKKMNDDLRSSVFKAEKINDDFAEHLKKLMKDIEDLHIQKNEKDKIIAEKEKKIADDNTFVSDVPFDEVRAPWMIKAENLHKELDILKQKLHDAEESIHLRDTEITILKSEIQHRKNESVYCDRVGFYCTPNLREEWR